MWKLLLATIIGAASTSAASAATIRLDRDTDQLYIVGKIVPGDFARFEAAIRRGNDDILAVNIVSPGGSVIEAVQIGRLIRKLSLSTNAPNTANFAPEARRIVCSVAAKIDRSVACTCVSACFLIWAGGVSRSGNDIHIHRISYDSDYYGSLSPAEAAIRYKEGLQIVRAYFHEVEMPDSIFEIMVSMPSYGTRPLPQSQNWWTPPSFAEWLTARCGHPSTRHDSTCEMETIWATTRKALQAYRAGQM